MVKRYKNRIMMDENGPHDELREDPLGDWVQASDYDMLLALLREGRGQSYGVMGIGTHKLIALKEWFAKVDAVLGDAK